MKIEQLIVQYLYNNKKVTLQDIGIFHLSPNVTIPADHDKDGAMPENAITFEYNTKAGQDDNLIDFIVKQTRKIKPLATSDLESFTILGRQFMNIGKPLHIEGLGILQKTQQGEYEFIQGHSINPRLEAIPALLKEKDKEEIVFTTPTRKRNSKSGILAAVIIVGLLIAFGIFYFLFKANKDQPTDQPVTQNTHVLIQKKDSFIKPADTLINQSLPADNNSYNFNIVINNYPTRDAAEKAFTKFTRSGRTLLVYSTDSSVYKLAIPFTNPLSDTTIVKDSLQRLFGRYIYVDLKK